MSDHQMITVVYKSVDSESIDTAVFLPNVDAARQSSCPVIIDIHGGAFMLGAREMVNPDQIRDCTDRGWIVVVPNHRLCPQVNVLEGPMQDCRDLLAWIYDGGLDKALEERVSTAPFHCDLDHVFAFGTSSGGHLALSLGFGVPRPVAGIFDMYGPCAFANPFWTEQIPGLSEKVPKVLETDIIEQVFSEKPVPIRGGVSLEGQQPVGGPDLSDPRQAFAISHIAHGQIAKAIFPSLDWKKIDPLLNIDHNFPPTIIVHGQLDNMVLLSLSKQLYQELQRMGVKCDMVEIPNESHTFATKMKVGSETWNLQRRGFDFLEDLIIKAPINSGTK